MKIKVYKPFWSYDVQKTEEWLSSMSEKGHELVEINRFTRYFIFRQGEQRKRLYKIGFDKMKQKSLSSFLTRNGWAMILQSGNWYVAANDKPSNEIESYPVRENIIKHNKKIMYLFGSIFIYLTVIVLSYLLIGLAISSSVQFGFVKSPLWIITFLYAGMGIMLWALSFYSITKIKGSNKRLLGESNYSLENNHSLENIYSQESRHKEESPSRDEIKRLRRSGEIVVKRRYAWTYEPDKLEKWLETMEEDGLSLYYVGKTGTTFYFKKGTPRKVSYCADYQNYVNEDYYTFHKEAGWKLIYFTSLNLQQWTLWSHEYSRDEKPPQLYSDKFHQLKHAKRVALTYSCLSILIVVVHLLQLEEYSQLLQAENFDISQMVQFLFSILVIFIFGSLTIRTWLYYRRIRSL
ncbi:DUF2812 domain-containing protein [Paenibacillus polygoni]|uniref:DUF2812 domain-containing protein n=1 Tax=Paenibacillus polygoni TaxID=3050112 RepID=A0ABY8WX93_9BACL|nr:DUF2812 domain-containing protein [Paenibacillus polygoni]WIV17631.1 DUF2812 domain-containing protein [Paenibacillus polygoni]